MRNTCRLVAWLLAAAIVALSCVPPTYRPVTAASHNFEHLAIFFAMGLAFGLAYQHRLRTLVFGLPAFCAVIEVTQQWVPGRHARLSDFLIDAAAVLIGMAAAFALARWLFPPNWLRRQQGTLS